MRQPERTETKQGHVIYGYRGRYMFDALDRMKLWEPHVAAVLGHWLKPGGLFVDAGAGLGCHTLYASRLVGPTGRVLAFEPCPDNYHCLLLSLAEARAVNVAAYPIALGPQLTPARLWLNPGNEGDNRIGQLRNVKWQDAVDTVVVPLDTFVGATVVPAVLKLDVQGGEPDVLAGATTFLTLYRPVIIAEENIRVYGNRLRLLLAELGYETTELKGRDILALPKEG